MAQKKKRNKAHRPQQPGAQLLKTQPWKVAAVFNPLVAILDQLEQEETIDVAANDLPVFKDAMDGRWYDTVAAVNGVIEAYEMHEERAGVELNLQPWRRLANKLQYGMMIFESDTKACRECLDRMKRATLTMTSDYAKTLIMDFQSKESAAKVAA